MKRLRFVGLFVIAGLCAVGVLVGGVGSAGAVPAVQVTYTLPAPVSTPQCTSDFGCAGGVTGYDYLGPGTNLIPNPPPIFPAGGAFHLVLTATRFLPQDPCRMREGTGTLDVTWADSTTSTGTYAFKARDSHWFSLEGTVTGGSNTAFMGAALDGLIALPTDPCVGGVVSASTITLYPNPPPI